jgi:hypothetical protein
MSKPEILNILVDNVVGNLESTTTPVVKWQYYDLNSEQRSYILKVGTSPGLNDILDTGEIFTDFNEHVVTPVGYDSALRKGIRYYITLIVSNASFIYSEESQTFFLTDGNYWSSHVDNSMGWTVEFYFKNNEDISDLEFEDLASVVTPEVNLPHHDVVIRDGVRSCSLELYVDRIILRGAVLATYFVDNRKFNLYRIVGQGDNLQIYVDDVLQIDIIESNTSETSVKEIIFGSTTNQLQAESTWCSILMNLDGIQLPYDLPEKGFDVTSFFFFEEDIVDSQLSLQVKDKVFVASNPTDTNKAGKLYSLRKNSKSVKRDARPFLSFEALNIIQDSRGAKWASTRNNIFRISGEFGGNFTEEYTFEEESNLTEFSRATNCLGECATFGNLLRINTSNESMDSFWYYETVKNSNSEWYVSADNDTGWTVEAEVRIADDDGAISEGAGFVINDGTSQETIYVFKNRILLKNSNIEAFYDFFTKPVQLRIVGVKSDIRVYVKVDEWELLVNGRGAFTGDAQILSDCSSPSSGVFSNKKMFSLWSSNKDGNWQLYSNEFNGVSWEAENQLTFLDGDCFNPNVYIDSADNAHIVYESNIFGNKEIFYGRYDGVGLVDVVRITDSAMDSITPKITVTDNGDIHVAWLDNRNINYEVYYAKYDSAQGEWDGSSAGGTDEKISASTSSAKNLKIYSASSAIYAMWDDDRNAIDSVYLNCNFGTSWKGEILVSDGINNASKPSATIDNSGILNIVWQDLIFGNSEIYYRTFNNSTLGTVERISATASDSFDPCVAEYGDGDLSVYWRENGDILFGTINNGVVNSSGGGGTDEVLSNSGISNMLSIDCIDFGLNNSNYLFYTGVDSHQTIC